MRTLFAAVAVAILMAGCSDSPTAPPPVATPDTQYTDDVISVQVPSLPTDEPQPGERTLNAVPVWRLGEWWTYKMTDEFSGNTIEFTRVVAGSEVNDYLVGFPIDAFQNDVMIFHIPGYGDIQRSDLSFEVHDARYSPLRFPLVGGDEWDVAFEGREGTATVVSAEGEKAEMHIVGSGFDITATYDAAVGEFTKLSYPGYATYEVTGHGFHYEGRVRVPHSHDLIFQHGRFGGAADVQGGLGIPPQVNLPTDDIEIGDQYDRASFVIILGPGALGLTQLPVSGGYYEEKITAPNQEQFDLTLLPIEGNLKIQAYGVENPTGTWHMEHTAVGPGAAFVEGIAYHSIDVDLPSGCVVQSLNAQHHAAECTVDRFGNEHPA